jgi:hypothetical protein
MIQCTCGAFERMEASARERKFVLWFHEKDCPVIAPGSPWDIHSPTARVIAIEVKAKDLPSAMLEINTYHAELATKIRKVDIRNDLRCIFNDIADVENVYRFDFY